MKNEYDINRVKMLGTEFVEVSGSSFCCEDLYEIIGKDQFMSTIIFKKDSESYEKFGKSVTGVLFYNKVELDVYRHFDSTKKQIIDKNIKIVSPMYELSVTQREELKYGGVSIEDIELVSFMTYKRDKEQHESGEKKIPNIIYIPLENEDNIDVDIFYQNYIASKINAKVSLIPYEKEKFIGITLGINDRHIDSRILDFLGYPNESIRNCENIWYHCYKAKERRKTISEAEKEKLDDLIFIREADAILRVMNEIKRSGINSEETSKSLDAIKTIISSAIKFEPSILLHGQKQIYWDLDSYIHIVMRHVRQLQLGRFRAKTPFPYRFRELKTLVEQVVRQVEHEIKRHFVENPEKDFKRVGRMCVLYNGDYYCVQINASGKLVNLYISGKYEV